MTTNITEKSVYHKAHKALTKRAGKKYKSTPFAIAALKHANETQSHRLKEIAAIYQCGRLLEVINGTATGKYCRSKYCVLCTTHRAMARLQKYSQAIQNLQNPTFITLTMPNCDVEQLPQAHKQFKQFWNEITKHYYKYKTPLQGLWKFEETINTKTQTVHPHMHILMSGNIKMKTIIPNRANQRDWKQLTKVYNPDKYTGKYLPFINERKKYRPGDRCKLHWTNEIIEAWLQRMPTANRHAQNAKPIGNNALDDKIKMNTIEMLKYTIKPFIPDKSEMTKAIHKNGKIYHDFNEVYVKISVRIMELMHQKRGFTTFGGFAKDEDHKTEQQITEEENQQMANKATIKGLPIEDTQLTLENNRRYVDTKTGEIIAEYIPTKNQQKTFQVLTNHETEEYLQQITENTLDRIISAENNYRKRQVSKADTQKEIIEKTE